MAEKLRLRLRYAAVKVQMGCEDLPFEAVERIVDVGLEAAAKRAQATQ